MNQPDISKIEDELTTLLSNDTTAELLMHRQLSDGETASSIALLNVRYREEINDNTRTVRQTALLLEQDDFDLPDFTLRPKVKGIAGKLFQMLGNMGIEFDDSPEFSEAYSVIGWVEPTVREFFVMPIRDHFAKDPKWSVCGHGKRLVIFQKGKVFKEDQHDAFIKETLPILTLFQMGEEALDARPDLRRVTRPEDMTASVGRMGGVVGAAMSRQLNAITITRSQLEQFAASTAPRTPPPAIARQVVGQVVPAIIAVVVSALVGAVFGTLCILMGQGLERLIAIPCFLMTCISIVGMYFLNRHRSRKTRVLRDGVLYEGTITDIKRTQVKVNEQRRYLVTIQSGQTKAVCRAYGMATDQAKAFKESGQNVRFLVDPTNAQNAICLDLLTISEG